MLAELCQLAAADTCVVDSLKDAAIGLTEDEVGAGWNRARQAAIVQGVELLELHHPRKPGGQDSAARPPELADLYGHPVDTRGHRVRGGAPRPGR
jgi:replicative DNA helicase